MTKKCPSCNECKGLDNFNKNKRTKSGYDAYCKTCKKRKRLEREERYAKKRKIITEKVCKTCGETKLVSEFPRNNKTLDGYNLHCKVCKSDKASKRAKRYVEDIHDTIDSSIFKLCGDCGKSKQLSEFTRKIYKKTGYGPYCKQCDCKRVLKHCKMKKYMVQRYLQKHTCIDCGESNWKLLENDHVNDDKYTFSSGYSCRTVSKLPTFTKIKAELEKCEVVCIWCHRIRTHSRFKGYKKCSALRQRKTFINQAKLAIGKCAHCSEVVHPSETYLFDWNHKDPSNKTINISSMMTHSLKEIEHEIHKCNLLCCKCHRLTTRNDRKWCDITQASENELQVIDTILFE
jgi:hypothetical protein